MMMRSTLRRWLLSTFFVLAAQLFILSGACGAEHLTYDSVITRYYSDDRQSFMADLETVAKEGDLRAALLLGLIQLDPGYGVPNRVEGLAWVRFATEPAETGYSAIEKAKETFAALEPRFSADERSAAIERAAELHARLEQHRQERTEWAQHALLDPSRLPSETSAPGCAGDPDLIQCRAARAHGMGNERCSGSIPKPDEQATTLGPGTNVVRPEFPRRALSEGFDGRVYFAAHVDRSGYVCRVVLLGSTWEPEIDRAVLDAASVWRWRPATVQGKPVEALQVASVTFVLMDHRRYLLTKNAYDELRKAVVRD